MFLPAQLENEIRFNELGLNVVAVSYIGNSAVELRLLFKVGIILGCYDLVANREKSLEFNLRFRAPSLIVYENILMAFK